MTARGSRHTAGAASVDLPGGTQSIQRAVAVLRILATAREAGLGLTEIAKQAELTRPTTHRILSVLIAEGIVERRQGSQRYLIGEQIPLLALSRRIRDPLLDIVSPHLRAAVRELGDTGFFTRWVGLETVCVARQLGTYPIQALAWDVGERRPLGVSNAGIAILSSMQTDAAREVLAKNRSRFSRYGLSTEAILQEVAVARSKGFAERAISLIPGASPVSVMIRSSFGIARGALTITPTPRRRSPERTEEIVACLLRHATAVEFELSNAATLRPPRR
ncbi:MULTISPECIES: helix-turn-helix domain-containing protein [unclassified Bradyrhizobium]|uniref:IclR family transcriptional regulator n=1 Tax=unclassified Bradyrhizobium TaxID=2631580 RepID=UPI001FF7B8C4|nr:MULTISPECIES: helix-turn-helix domain-containing protein [unclassified Bradyrhizobium]MCK1294972.1 helix-turn-helix domain-containing protein [Bradyrhizobium sp. 30]MCK1309394.1 helix-turn-helix domain-containing protein [Bradyrhizobium sp. 45]MCK1315003.1 helix-turn-helix domain-containing protein [Bradyrhizobium sp. 23]MCK1439831.1 helix-turn-helix domain-containing protein [Bradyrhizobium sp. 15]MCK1456770.1 helix-turn-helix domain-containing protein [Bradyrhizobium sp. 35]